MTNNMTSTHKKLAVKVLPLCLIALAVTGMILAQKFRARRHTEQLYASRAHELAAANDALAQYQQQLINDTVQLRRQGLQGDSLVRQLKVKEVIADSEFHNKMKQIERSEAYLN